LCFTFFARLARSVPLYGVAIVELLELSNKVVKLAPTGNVVFIAAMLRGIVRIRLESIFEFVIAGAQEKLLSVGCFFILEKTRLGARIFPRVVEAGSAATGPE
jgi:hypothetical protein